MCCRMAQRSLGHLGLPPARAGASCPTIVRQFVPNDHWERFRSQQSLRPIFRGYQDKGPPVKVALKRSYGDSNANKRQIRPLELQSAEFVLPVRQCRSRPYRTASDRAGRILAVVAILRPLLVGKPSVQFGSGRLPQIVIRGVSSGSARIPAGGGGGRIPLQ